MGIDAGNSKKFQAEENFSTVGSERLPQQFGQGQPGPGHPGFDGSRRQAQDLSDLLIGGAVEFPEHQHLPVFFRQPGESFGDGPPELFLFQRPVRGGGGVGELTVPASILVVQGQVSPPLLFFSEKVDGGI